MIYLIFDVVSLDAVTVVLYNMMKNFNKMDSIPVSEVNNLSVSFTNKQHYTTLFRIRIRILY